MPQKHNDFVMLTIRRNITVIIFSSGLYSKTLLDSAAQISPNFQNAWYIQLVRLQNK